MRTHAASPFHRGSAAQVSPGSWLSGLRVLPTTDNGWKTYSGGSRLFLPTSTNYCTNPSFELDTDSDGRADSWSTWASNVGGTPVFSRVSALRGQGSYAQRLSYTGVAGDSDAALRCITDTSGVDSVAPDDVLTVSVDMLGTLSGTKVVLEAVWLKADGSIISLDGGSYLDLTATVDRYSHTTVAPALASRFRIGVLFLEIAEGDTIDASFDDVLIEKSSICTPYFDGSYPDCAWAGTANASTSTRTACELVYAMEQAGVDMLSLTGGTIAARVTPLGFASPTFYVAAEKAAVGGVYGTLLYGGAIDVNNHFYVANDASFKQASSVHARVVGDPFVAVGRYGLDTVDLSAGTTDAAEQSGLTAPAAVGPVHVGGWISAENPARAYIGPLIISPTRKSDAWVSAIRADGGAAFGSLSTLWNTYMEPGDTLFPLNGSSIGYRKRLGSGPPFDDAVIAFDGNSTTVGYGSTPGQDYPSVVMAALAASHPQLQFAKINAAMGGATVADLHGAAIDAAYDAYNAHNICCVLCGQLDGGPSADTVAALGAYCAARQATGWQVVICTLPSYAWELDAAHVRTDINTLIRSQYAGWADALADLAADGRIGDDGDYLDGTYFLDDIHMIDAGYAIVAGIVETAIEGLL